MESPRWRRPAAGFRRLAADRDRKACARGHSKPCRRARCVARQVGSSRQSARLTRRRLFLQCRHLQRECRFFAGNSRSYTKINKLLDFCYRWCLWQSTGPRDRARPRAHSPAPRGVSRKKCGRRPVEFTVSGARRTRPHSRRVRSPRPRSLNPRAEPQSVHGSTTRGRHPSCG